MKWVVRVLLVIGVLVFAVPLAMLLLASVALQSMCGNHVLSETSSPSGQTRAVVFQRDCGATTDFSTQVSILQAGESLPDEGGNAFVADSDHGQAPAGPGGGPAVDVRWAGNSELVIRHDARARLFSSEATVEGVRVRYEPL